MAAGVGKGGRGVGVLVGVLVGVEVGPSVGVGVAVAAGVEVEVEVGVEVAVGMLVGVGVSVGKRDRAEGNLPVKIKPQKAHNNRAIRPIIPIQIKVERFMDSSEMQNGEMVARTGKWVKLRNRKQIPSFWVTP